MDLMLEALNFLTLKTSETSLEVKLNRLQMLHTDTNVNTSPAFQARITAVRALALAIDSHHTPDAKELDHFFSTYSTGEGNLALTLIMSFYDPAIALWDDQMIHIEKAFDAFCKEPRPDIAKLHLGNIIYENDDSPERDAWPVEEQLDSTELSDQEKWILLRMLKRPDQHLHRLTQMLIPIKNLIAENFSIIQPMLDDFTFRWREYFQQNMFSAFLSQCMGLEFGDNKDYTVHVYPYIFDSSTISLNMDEDEKNIYLKIGACMSEGVTVKTLPIKSNHLLEGLKALSDKSKLAILDHIRNKRSYGQALAKETGLSTATISHHMSALINCGFIRMEKEDNRIYYQMDKDRLQRFLQHLSLYLLDGEGTGKPHT